MTKECKKEQRYIVIKVKDLDAAKLSPREKTDLYDILFKINIARKVSGKDPLNCVVVESDWPEYENTWKSIEERVKNGSL